MSAQETSDSDAAPDNAAAMEAATNEVGGFALKIGKGSASIGMECPHQNGLLYMVPADRSWVCEDDLRPAHVLAGFFKDITALDDARIRDAMNRWGLYYRSRPLAGADSDTGGA